MNKLRNYAQQYPNTSGEMMTVKAYVERMSLQRRAITLTPKSSRSWFYANELANIYKFPNPVYTSSASNVTLGVVSFGGGLTGTLSSEGVLTDGDVQAYWTALGIASQNHPKVIIKTISGAKNNPTSISDDGTAENTLDVETIGACCPTSKLTIILYIAPNSLSEFSNILNYINTSPVVVNGTSYLPSIVSISWGLPETYYGTHLTNINNILKTLSAKGVNICVATGDFGSSNGTDSNNVDFPSSSPFVIACGGTSLICPNLTYDAETKETAWSGSGGGVSVYFSKPDYQSALSTTGTKRSTPDIALNADPATGVAFYIFKKWHIFGGTSVSAPTFAAYLAALNATTFANTKLYTAPANNFNDIKSGINGAFSAGAGYDNVTGLGSIIGNLLAPSLTTINVPVSKIQLNNPKPTLAVGGTFQLTPTVLPTNATNQQLNWVSSNPAIVLVSNNGFIIGVKTGSALISCYTMDGSKVAVTASVTVNKLVNITTIKLDRSSYTLHKGTTYQIATSVIPSTANPTIVWSSNNPRIVHVNQYGLLTGLSNGTAIITAQSLNKQVSTNAKITVINRNMKERFITNAVTIPLTQTYTLQIQNMPQIPINYTWGSTNPLVIVSPTGVVSTSSRRNVRSVITLYNEKKEPVDRCNFIFNAPV